MFRLAKCAGGAGAALKARITLTALKAATALGFASLLALPLPAAAQSVWGGSGSTTATSDYNTATNWSTPPGVAPTAPGTSATFANTGQSTVNVSAAVNPDSWTFATSAQSYAIAGSAVTFNTGTGLVDNANAGQSIDIANSLNGAGALVQNGNGTLTLSNINFYTGATTINSGATLALSGGAGISSSSVVTANGTFDISASGIPFNPITTLAGTGTVQLGGNGLVITAGSTEFSGTIAGGGGLEIVGGTQTLSGVNAYTNLTQIDPGATLALKGNGRSPTPFTSVSSAQAHWIFRRRKPAPALLDCSIRPVPPKCRSVRKR